MSKDLLDRKLERNEREVISMIFRGGYIDYSLGSNRPEAKIYYKIVEPEEKKFDSFQQAYNFLIRKGYKADASENKNLTNLLNKIIESNLKNSNKTNEPAVVLMMFQKVDV